MGTYGYAPCDGDGPHDLESEAHVAVARHLIKLFKKPLRKGSVKLVRPEVMKSELEKAGIERPKSRKGRMVDRRALKRFWEKAKKVRAKIMRRKDPSLFRVIQNASGDRWNRLGAVQILSERGIWIPVSVVKKCRDDLRELKKDDGYASVWSDPKLFALAVKNMLENVELILARDKIQQRAVKQRRARSRRKWPRSRSGPRLVYDAFFRDRPGERKWKGCLTLLPIPQHNPPRKKKKA
jgi:hypothetical protein